ncbi:MAG TPA: aminoacetone oxidase family FAD-binding enzyme [Lachnospiraceae bacterium]|nr:aminoacetone oxidase family FAD-binding enzyme [Lachnospiraceae bacterium]
MDTDVLIVGGGAAGLVAAIVAARNGARVTIIEHKEKIGKKILATGNGKCNYTNMYQSIDCYRSENLSFAGEVFSHFDAQATVAFFKELGIFPKSRNGYLYPYSEQASSVVEVLEMELKNLNVQIICNQEVVSITKKGEKFYIDTIETGKDTSRKLEAKQQISAQDCKVGNSNQVISNKDNIKISTSNQGNGKKKLSGKQESLHLQKKNGKDGKSGQSNSALKSDFGRLEPSSSNTKERLKGNDRRGYKQESIAKQEITYRSTELVSLKETKGFVASRVILATGGKASSALGSDGSGYTLAKSLGHQIISLVPALVQLKAEGKFFPAVAGVRCDVSLELLVEKTNDQNRTHSNPDTSKQGKEYVQLATESGELQLTNYGISGIPVFQISRFAARALERKEKVIVRIDFLPQISIKELYNIIENRIRNSSYKSTEQMLTGLLNSKLIPLFVEKAGIARNSKVHKLNESTIETLVHLLKDFRVQITDTNSFDNAQVCAGGVNTREVEPMSLESKINKGLYLTGELLDVDGICGGYNLQWAWSTGYLAGKAAATSIRK